MMQQQTKRINQKLFELLDEPAYESLAALVDRFVPVGDKTIGEIMSELEALDDLYDDYQGGLNRIMRYSRGKAALSEKQVAIQAEIALFHFVCYKVRQLCQWLEGSEETALPEGWLATK